MTSQTTEALVVGGGLAGCAVAMDLARSGRSITLLERSKGPHDKVCGEFLSGEALYYLDRYGVDAAALGGVAIRSVRLAMGRMMEEASLPFAAMSITRRRLDEELLRAVEAAGADVHRGCVVESLARDGGGWCATTRDERCLQAQHAFLATGKHDLRGWPRPAGTHAGLIAFKMYYRLTRGQHAALGNAVELILFPGGYAGLQPVEDGAANLCLLMSKRQFQSIGASWLNLLQHLAEHSEHLAERLRGATALLGVPLAASHIPYGHMQRPTQDGLWRVGDQAAVIPSFCGDGMAIALHSGAMAAEYFLQGSSAASFHARLRKQLGTRLAVATRLSQLMVGLPQAARVISLSPRLLTGIAAMTRIPRSALLASNSLSMTAL